MQESFILLLKQVLLQQDFLQKTVFREVNTGVWPPCCWCSGSASLSLPSDSFFFKAPSVLTGSLIEEVAKLPVTLTAQQLHSNTQRLLLIARRYSRLKQNNKTVRALGMSAGGT